MEKLLRLLVACGASAVAAIPDEAIEPKNAAYYCIPESAGDLSARNAEP
jgi:hypothetical protein